MKTVTFQNHTCVELSNSAVSLLITQSTGPRILSLRLNGKANILAELPDFTIDCPDVGTFHIHGGHRLWHAPEVARRTYLPDDDPVQIEPIENGVLVTQKVEAETGLQKSLRITLPDDGATVVIDHMLTNRGLWPVECAPWAITQMKAGGFAIVPQTTRALDPDGLQPNRPISLWPYTDINSPHIQWGNQYIFVHANMTEGALKIGCPNPTGWIGYVVDGMLFVKSAEFDPTATYYDFGSSTQCYCNEHFLELETLAPRSTIQPNATATHREIWRLFDNITLKADESAVAEQLRVGLGL